MRTPVQRRSPVLSFALLLVLAAGALPASAAEWRWLQPRPTGADLRDVALLDSQTAYAVGAGPTILRTRDGGNTWEQRPAPGAADLVAVSAAGNQVVAVGPLTVLRSVDGGATFTLFALPPGNAANQDFVDVSVVDSNTAYIASRDGTIWRTTNAFQSLVARSRLTLGTPAGLRFDSAQRGWVVGESATGAPRGFIARTLDGGQTFSQVHSGEGGGFHAIDSVNLNGYAVVVAAGSTQPRGAASSDDGQGARWSSFDLLGGPVSSVSFQFDLNLGEVWFAATDGMQAGRFGREEDFQRVLSLSRPRIWSVGSAGVGSALAVGEGGTILRATYGSPPSVVTLGGRRGERFTGGSFPSADGRFGVVIDNQPGAPRLWVTRNGGASLSALAVAQGPIAAVSFVDESTGFGVLENGDFGVTASGPENWQLRTRLNFRPTSLAFAGARAGYAAGDGIWRTEDAGVTWAEALPLSTSGRVSALAVRGTGIAAAATAQGLAWRRSGDFAGRWTLQSTGGPLSSVAIAEDGRIVAGGASGTSGLLVIVPASGSSTTLTLPRPILGVAAVTNRLFVLLDGGEVAEVEAGALKNRYRSGARMLALLPRMASSAPGPIAVGDFGSLLAFEDAPSPNQPPLVKVVPGTLELGENQSATLAAEATDPEGEALTYRWSDPGGRALAFGSPTSATTEVKWADGPGPGGAAIARLTVCDARGACTSVDVQVSWREGPAQNRPPVAFARGATVRVGEAAVLDGSGSYDPEGAPITYLWRQLTGPAAVVEGGWTSPTLRIAASASASTRVFELTVCDPQLACARAEATLVVAAAQNLPPVVVVPGSFEVSEWAEFSLDASGSRDPEGGALSFAWRVAAGSPAPTLQNADRAVALVPKGAAAGEYRFIVRVCDALNECAEAGLNVKVVPRAPLPLRADAGPDQRVPSGARVQLDGSRSDPGGRLLWTQLSGPTVTLANPDGFFPSFTAPTGPATLEFRLRVSSSNDSATDDVRVVVDPPSRLPLADAGPDQEVGLSARVQLDGRGSADPLGRPLTYRWTAPAGIALSGADLPVTSFIAPAEEASLQVELEVCVELEPSLCARDRVAVRVVRGGNLPPRAEAGVDRIGHSQGWVVLDGSQSLDPDGGAISYAWTQLRGPRATIESPTSATTSVSLPRVADLVTLVFELQVCDAKGACSTDEVNVFVLPRDERFPTVTLSLVEYPDAAVPEEAEFELKATATCPAAPCAGEPTIRLASGPALAPLDTAARRWRAPRVLKSVPFVLEASVCDTAARCSAARVYGVVVDSVNEPPVAHPGPPQTARARQRVVLDASRSRDPNGEPLTFRWEQLGGPLPLELSSLEVARPRLEVPARNALGEYAFQVTVCDPRGACDDAVALLTVEPGAPVNRPPVADAGGNRGGEVGAEILLDGSGSFDPDGDALTYRWVLSSLPPAQLMDPGAARARLVFSAAVSEPVVVALEVCDPQGACSEDSIEVRAWLTPELPPGEITLGALAGGCACGSGASPLSALALLGLLLRRRRRG